MHEDGDAIVRAEHVALLRVGQIDRREMAPAEAQDHGVGLEVDAVEYAQRQLEIDLDAVVLERDTPVPQHPAARRHEILRELRTAREVERDAIFPGRDRHIGCRTCGKSNAYLRRCIARVGR